MFYYEVVSLFLEAATLEEGTTTRPQKVGQRTPNDGARYLRRTELLIAPLPDPENLHLQKFRVWVDKAGGRVRLIKHKLLHSEHKHTHTCTHM